MTLTILNRSTGEFRYVPYSEWDFDKRSWLPVEPPVSYERFREFIDHEIHPVSCSQLFHGEPTIADGDDCIVVRAETEFGILYERDRDAIDTYQWKRSNGLH